MTIEITDSLIDHQLKRHVSCKPMLSRSQARYAISCILRIREIEDLSYSDIVSIAERENTSFDTAYNVLATDLTECVEHVTQVTRDYDISYYYWLLHSTQE